MGKLTVDKKRCIGCGLCTAFAPGVFRIGKNGKAEVNNNSRKPEAQLKSAIDACPVQAISAKD